MANRYANAAPKKAAKQVSFNVTKAESEKIRIVVDRALRKNKELDRLSLEMDITATHANGCRLDFDKLLSFDDFNFVHDVYGIIRHIDRSTGEMTMCFMPRSAENKAKRRSPL